MAVGISVVPGAIICKDVPTVNAVYELYVDYWGEATQDTLTHGTSRILRGPPALKPDPAFFGCTVLPPGTPVHINPVLAGIVQVSVKSNQGEKVLGITFESMVVTPEQIKERLRFQSPPLPQPDQKESAPTQTVSALPRAPGKDGVGYPSCIYCPDPKMSPEARVTQFSGVVVLQITVGTDGRASDIKIVQRVGYGLDEEVVASVKNWRFKPALGPDGSPVPTSVPVEVQFRSTVR